jgi:hypothetical protein
VEKYNSYDEISKTERGISYYDIDLKNEKEMCDVIPKKHQHNFFGSVMNMNFPIPPHIDDLQIKTTINFYIKTDNCITQFYKLNENAKEYRIDSQSSGCFFDANDLIQDDYFVAKDDDAFILDVTVPHVIWPLNNTNWPDKININNFHPYLMESLRSKSPKQPNIWPDRNAYCLRTNKYYFNEVCDMLRETGNLT